MSRAGTRSAEPLMRAAADMSWQHAILAEEFAEPTTFTTAVHRRAVDALLSKTERASSSRG